jgi:hypothetical protein
MTDILKRRLSRQKTTLLRKLAKAATPGPWQVYPEPNDEWIGLADSILDGAHGPGGIVCNAPHDFAMSMNFWPANAAFIAAAHPTVVLALLDEIDALRNARRLKP